ncbi:MAG: AI-2E family transporter [Candidatus Omnitrophica bacterium]|nr:AI-2E family transporter [Candidatus Omnitrophota bacterium]
MTRDQIISLFFLALLIFVIMQVCSILAPFMTSIFWAAILAFGFYPLYAKIKNTTKMPEIPASILMTFLIFLIVIPPLILVVVNITGQTIELYQTALDYVRQGRLEKLINELRSFSLVQSIETHLFQWEIVQQTASSWLLNTTKNLGNYTAAQVGTITKNIVFISLNGMMMTFLVFIFLKDGGKIHTFIYDAAPLENKNKSFIFAQIHDVFSAVIRGQLLTSVVQSMLAGTMFWFLGIPIPIFFAIATFISSLIPLLGAAGVWLPLAVFLFFQQSYLKCVILLVFGFFVISLIDNVLKPALIGEKTKLPFVLLFFGMLGGIKVYGLMGIFLAPVFLSLFFALIKIYQEKYLKDL